MAKLMPQTSYHMMYLCCKVISQETRRLLHNRLWCWIYLRKYEMVWQIDNIGIFPHHGPVTWGKSSHGISSTCPYIIFETRTTSEGLIHGNREDVLLVVDRYWMPIEDHRPITMKHLSPSEITNKPRGHLADAWRNTDRRNYNIETLLPQNRYVLLWSVILEMTDAVLCFGFFLNFVLVSFYCISNNC